VRPTAEFPGPARPSRRYLVRHRRRPTGARFDRARGVARDRIQGGTGQPVWYWVTFPNAEPQGRSVPSAHPGTTFATPPGRTC